MKLIFITLSFVVCVFFHSCQEHDELLDNKHTDLVFSTDSVSFDTLFTTLGSVTKTLIVKNPSKRECKIDEISLTQNKSYFMLNIDGERASYLQNIVILPNDSIFIYIQVLLDVQAVDNPVIVEDSIIFRKGDNSQYVNLLAYGQNVNIIKSVFYETNTTWSAERPYLVMDSINVMPNSSLTIEEGSIIYFYNKSKMNVYGNINALGTIERPIVFRGHRLDEIWHDYPYDLSSGQWGGIRIYPSADESIFENCRIRNATNAFETGSLLGEETCRIKLLNTIIHNSFESGLFAINSKIKATNCQITNSGHYNIFLAAGGDYAFYHCTIANFYGLDHYAKREKLPCLVVSNAVEDGVFMYYNALSSANFYNCIIDGSFDNEIVFQMTDLVDFNFMFANTVIKVNESIKDDFPASFRNCYYNEKIEYLSVKSLDYDFRLDTLSFALNKGDIEIVKKYGLEFDLLGASRFNDGLPDLGTYEFQ